ncbi:SAM-dependent methyltransferase [Pleionea litopenaei]|uniref:SAM-dependent methyltransferase n=1 Tax=Pleionea litopenaei TaxID=3070815 RepID=A0AA51RU02_9GAMM|nr:SAM-dependent methyltransferase [Pleionea sp. HL-JVS1]WMS87485.1 SAM-dependent methyltransferase [Pleionea sp. HL-JVS1]
MGNKGRLFVVGTGLITPSHITQETKKRIESADQVYHLVPDPLGLTYLKSLNENLTYLGDSYQLTATRTQAYQLMVDRILEGLNQYSTVVAVFYGHPGVFVSPSHEVITQARRRGYDAQMLPGISAEDCLFADLGIDPASDGCQSYEATHFLIHKIQIDLCAPLILWQPGVIGDIDNAKLTAQPEALKLLQKKLIDWYGSEHPVIKYEAATLPLYDPLIESKPLSKIHQWSLSQRSTFYIAAQQSAMLDDSVVQQLVNLKPSKENSDV